MKVSDSTIMLAQPKPLKHIDADGLYVISEKLDGVPVRIERIDGKLTAVSRQGKPVLSIQHILDHIDEVDGGNTTLKAGELWIKGEPFKYINGLARRQETSEETKQLVLHLFTDFPATNYDSALVRSIPFHLGAGSRLIDEFCGDKWEPSEAFHKWFADKLLSDSVKSKTFEGYIARRWGTPWEPNKRSNNFLKLVSNPTLDLKVINVVPAKKPKVEGEPQEYYPRIGSFICMWGDGETCNVGSGKLKHAESEQLWGVREELEGRIIQVKYKRDPSYDTPREPTFQCFRDDKSEFELEM